jgi:DNA-binding SARP family transcriptional activator
MKLEIDLLGGFVARVDGRTIDPAVWRLRKAAQLVKLLALARGHALHREQLFDLLWPDSAPAAASSNLRYALHVARRTLHPDAAHGSSFLRWQGDLLHLTAPGGLVVDVEELADGARTARASRDPAQYRLLLDRYVGDLLPEDRYDGSLEPRRQWLRAVRQRLAAELAALNAAPARLVGNGGASARRTPSAPSQAARTSTCRSSTRHRCSRQK